MIDEGEVNIVDIRDIATFNAGHIENAEHLDNNGVQAFISDTEHNLPLIVCCYHGNSSQAAGEYLAEQGFEQVFSLDGGYIQWQATYPDDCEKE